MRTKLGFIIASALLLLSCSVSSEDNYVVGLKKMMSSNAMESVDMESITKLTNGKSVTVEQVQDMFVEQMATYYRENMSLDEFNSMVEFCTSPEYIEVKERVSELGFKNMETDMENICSESNMNSLTTNILSGKECETTPKLACSPEYDAEIETFLELSNFDGIMNGILPLITESIMAEAEVSPNSEELKPVMEKMVEELCKVLIQECKVSVANSLISNVPIEDLKKHNSIKKQPFYANMQKANAALAANIVTISLNIAQEIMQK